MTKLTTKQVREDVKWLRKNNCGCCYYPLTNHDPNNNWAIVVGWNDGEVCIKLAYQPKKSLLQCDYDVDWLMPVDKETGIVWDTDTVVCGTQYEIDSLYDAWEQIRALYGI